MAGGHRWPLADPPGVPAEPGVQYTAGPVRRLWIARSRSLACLACAATLALASAGCGQLTHHVASAENNGVYVNAGPITYQLQISRQLNQYSVEDSRYVAGVPRGQASLGPDQLWYGVFLDAKNQNKISAPTTANFVILDTQGRRYYPIPLNPALNPYAWSAQVLPPGGVQPTLDSTAYFGATQGQLLLFKLNLSVYDNRPLTLEIRGPQRQLWGTISLDL